MVFCIALIILDDTEKHIRKEFDIVFSKVQLRIEKIGEVGLIKV